MALPSQKLGIKPTTLPSRSDWEQSHSIAIPKTGEQPHSTASTTLPELWSLECGISQTSVWGQCIFSQGCPAPGHGGMWEQEGDAVSVHRNVNREQSGNAGSSATSQLLPCRCCRDTTCCTGR